MHHTRRASSSKELREIRWFFYWSLTNNEHEPHSFRSFHESVELLQRTGMSTFGTILRRVRQDRHIDQATLGGLIETSRATISQWENGHRLPDAAQIIALCNVLHISADMLLGRVPLLTGEASMVPPNDNQNRPSPEQVRKALETARQVGKQPFRLTTQERQEFKRDILSAMGRD